MDASAAHAVDAQAPDSVTRLFLVPEGEDIHGIVGRFVSVQSHKSGVAEGNHQLMQFGDFRIRSPHIGGRFQQQELPLDRLTRAPGGIRGFRGERAPAPLQTFYGARSDDYSWHSGAAPSSSVPHVLNQSRASCPVRCWPVSR